VHLKNWVKEEYESCKCVCVCKRNVNILILVRFFLLGIDCDVFLQKRVKTVKKLLIDIVTRQNMCNSISGVTSNSGGIRQPCVEGLGMEAWLVGGATRIAHAYTHLSGGNLSNYLFFFELSS